jgi:serine/threonine protein kinase
LSHQADLLQAALDVAHGMQHLHKKKIIHGDLNPTNVLLHVEAAPHLFSGSCALIGDEGLGSSSGGHHKMGPGGGLDALGRRGTSGGSHFWVTGVTPGAKGSVSGGVGSSLSDARGFSSAVGAGGPGSSSSIGYQHLVSASHRVVAKIADFGLSVKMPQNASHVSGHRVGTPFYVAPEVAQRGKMTTVSAPTFTHLESCPRGEDE